MPRESIQPSVPLARFLRNKRQELGLTLREISEKLAASGDPIPPSTLARIEQGKTDPGVRRANQLLRLYQVPPQLAADMTELEDLAVEQPVSGDLQTLYDEGIAAWKRGDIPKGLAYLFAVRQYVPDGEESRLMRQKATLSFAIMAREVGKYRLAKQLVDDLLCEPADQSLIINLLVLAASVWRGLGSLESAIAFLRQAETHLDTADRQQQGWIFQQKARLLLEAGKPSEAAEALDAGLRAYRAAGDGVGEVKGMLTRIAVLEAAKNLPAALRAARDAQSLASRRNHAQFAAMARLEVGRLQVKSGATAKGLEVLQEVLGRAVVAADRNTEFLAHYHLWRAHRALADQERARFELEAAGYFVRFVDGVSPEAEEVKIELEKARAAAPASARRSPRRAYALDNAH